MAGTDNEDPGEGRRATFGLEGWYGRIDVPILVIGETPKRYRARLLADARLPGNRQHRAGDVVLLPKWIVYFEDAQGGAEGDV